MTTKKTQKSKKPLAVTTKELELLLSSHGLRQWQLDDAVDRRVIKKQKIEGRWVFFDAESIADVEQEVEDTARSVISSWFIAGMAWLPGTIRNRLKRHFASRGVVELLLRQFVRRRVLEALPLLTRAYQPHLALYLPDHRAEVERNISHLKTVLEKRGQVGQDELLAPSFKITMEVWRQHLLAHGEYLGLGKVETGMLVAWPRQP